MKKRVIVIVKFMTKSKVLKDRIFWIMEIVPGKYITVNVYDHYYGTRKRLTPARIIHDLKGWNWKFSEEDLDYLFSIKTVQVFNIEFPGTIEKTSGDVPPGWIVNVGGASIYIKDENKS